MKIFINLLSSIDCLSFFTTRKSTSEITQIINKIINQNYSIELSNQGRLIEIVEKFIGFNRQDEKRTYKPEDYRLVYTPKFIAKLFVRSSVNLAFNDKYGFYLVPPKDSRDKILKNINIHRFDSRNNTSYYAGNAYDGISKKFYDMYKDKKIKDEIDTLADLVYQKVTLLIKSNQKLALNNIEDAIDKTCQRRTPKRGGPSAPMSDKERKRLNRIRRFEKFGDIGR